MSKSIELHKESMKRIIAAAGLLAIAYGASAQTGKYTWQDIGQRLKASQAISPLGPDISGDQVSLSNGALSFSATDLSLPGNGTLSVAFSRSYNVTNRKEYYGQEMLADWSVDLPNISGSFSTDWVVPGAAPGNRCTDTSLPPLPTGGYTYSDYWQGLTIDVSGGGGEEMLVAAAGISKPSTGGPYVWGAGNGTIHIACLTTIKNTTGQGFIATLPNGTRVWFDWMAQYSLPSLKGNSIDINGSPVVQLRSLKRNVLYATRVEDRFGNYVTYTYTNAWNAPGKLTSIQANDGRQITLGYSGSTIASISDGSRTWSYAYGNSPRSRKTLSSVTLPDSSTWSIVFSAFTDAEIKYNEAAFDEPLRSCTMIETPLNYDETRVGSITHPSGGTGTFTINIQEHGRSGVPVSCGHVTTFPSGAAPGTGNNTNDDLNLWAISDNSYTLIKKQVSGPGITAAEWNYTYVPGISFIRDHGATFKYPVCNWATYGVLCSNPHCLQESCAGSSRTTVSQPDGNWVRYSYGNTYRYNEGKLLKVETGASGSTTALKTVTNTYDLTLGSVAKPYPASYGSSQRTAFDGFSSQYHRPLETTDTDQDGMRFKSQVDTFDGLARPLQVTKSSAPFP